MTTLREIVDNLNFIYIYIYIYLYIYIYGRDDRLGVVKNKNGPETEKNIQKNKLYIVIQWNMKIVNCLDLSVNLNNSNYKPYHKLDIEILYIHKD